MQASLPSAVPSPLLSFGLCQVRGLRAWPLCLGLCASGTERPKTFRAVDDATSRSSVLESGKNPLSSFSFFGNFPIIKSHCSKENRKEK